MPSDARLPLTTLANAGHPANPKDHDIGGIITSLARFGMADPVVVDGRTGLIASGHGRVEAMVAMHNDGQDAPAGVQVNDTGDWLVPVYTGWSSADDTEAQAALVALNAWVEQGGWHTDQLAELLGGVAGSAAGLLGVGYDESDLAALLMGSGDFAPPSLDDLADEYGDPDAHDTGGGAAATAPADATDDDPPAASLPAGVTMLRIPVPDEVAIAFLDLAEERHDGDLTAAFLDTFRRIAPGSPLRDV